MQKKILSLALAVTFIFAALGGLMFIDDQSDAATTTTGHYSVYAYNGTSWSSDSVSTYDAAQAVAGSSMWDASTDSMVPKYIPATPSYPYVTYNYDTYGNITTFMGLTSDTSNNYWHLYKITTGQTLSPMAVNLGSYNCFSDYNSTYRASNIVLYYGDSTVTNSVVKNSLINYLGGSGVTQLVGFTAVSSSNSDFAVTFTIHNSTSSNAIVSGSVVDNNGITISDTTLKNNVINITGYGSNAYLALINAIGSANINAENTIPGQSYYMYSWMYNMYGLSTQQNGNIWTYWATFDQHSSLGDTTNNYSDFVLGAYSPLDCAPITDNSFALYYM